MNIYVGNLPYRITEDEVQDVLAPTVKSQA